MKTAIHIISALALSLAAGHCRLGIAADSAGVIYVVAGIMFCTAMSKTANFPTVRNEVFRRKLRGAVDSLRRKCAARFLTATAAALIPTDATDAVDVPTFKGTLFALCVAYYVVSFMLLQKLTRKVEDMVEAERDEWDRGRRNVGGSA